MQASTNDDIFELTDIEEEEIELLHRDVDERIITKFKFNPQNNYEKQSGNSLTN